MNDLGDTTSSGVVFRSAHTVTQNNTHSINQFGTVRLESGHNLLLIGTISKETASSANQIQIESPNLINHNSSKPPVVSNHNTYS